MSIRKKFIPTCLKYLFSLLLTVYTIKVDGSVRYALFGLLELIIIFAASNIIATHHIHIARVCNAVVLLVFNTETLVFCFAGQHIKMIMLENISSFEDLSGDYLKYGLGVIGVLFFSVIPITHISFEKAISRVHREGIYHQNGVSYNALSIALVLELVFTMLFGNSYSNYSTLFSVKLLYDEHKNSKELALDITGKPNMTSKFYNDSIISYTDINPTNEDCPNIVLVFAEGLSQNIIDDERNIMPNTKRFESESICFENYFNNTAATYHGLISQLYSGYQRQNSDSNSLISIQSILKNHGYNTAFINTEPKNKEFSRFLNNLGFDTIIDDEKLEGPLDSIADEDAFDLVLNSMKELSKQDAPFFLSIYTFGTHNTFDSTDKKYGNGTDRLLNKFYNLDYHFGSFMQSFKQSSFHDNTIIVFTADHCTYAAYDYRETFPEYPRDALFLDRIPFAVYYDGVTPISIDAAGRNSLDMAPTLLDLLGISSPNYFLGSSLFNEEIYADSIDNIYWGDDLLTSAGGVINHLDSQRATTAKNTLVDYFTACQQKPQKP